MNALLKKIAARNWEVPVWVWEILIIAAVLPALVHGVASLNGLPPV
jgi:hypothetical protein